MFLRNVFRSLWFSPKTLPSPTNVGILHNTTARALLSSDMTLNPKMEEMKKAARESPVVQRCLNLFRDPPYGIDVHQKGQLVKFTVPSLKEDNTTFQYYKEKADLPVASYQDFICHWYYKLQFEEVSQENAFSDFIAGYGVTTIYTKCTRTTLTPDFYKKPIHENFLSPGTVEYELANAGKTSLTSIDRWFNSKGELLASIDIMDVLMDFTTRKPTSLPEAFVEKYGAAKKKIQFDLKEPDAIPENAETLKYMVTEKHIDENNHMNLVEYVRFSEMAFQACSRGNQQVKQLLMVYHKENSLGDKLCLKYWQDGSDADIVHVYCLNLTHQHTSSYAKFTLHQQNNL